MRREDAYDRVKRRTIGCALDSMEFGGREERWEGAEIAMGRRSNESRALKWMTDDAGLGTEAVMWSVEHADDVSRSPTREFPALPAPWCL
ncbi:hypothetical protein MRB53_019692 [Persea americana]|uniref:Uncharacterized protein n=1 Tax=Persea americana TaxID=3435 RepID=A0ACC2KYX8_PERAE|nr:hypothetical protein MRB53_019692 [Persea americana]